MTSQCIEKKMEARITFLAKGGVQKKRFQYCSNPKSSKHFLYFGAIQGHSGGDLVDPTLQDNVLLPDDFAEYIHHIGNAHDMPSIIKSRLMPGGNEPQEGQAVSVFHSFEPDVLQSRSGRSSIRSGQTQNTVCKILESSPKYCILVQYEASGIHENWRGSILQSKSIPKVTARRTYAKFEMWTSESASSRSEKIHRPSQRTQCQLQGNLSR